MKRLSLILVCLLGYSLMMNNLNAQSTDSLKQAVLVALNDSSKAEIYLKLSFNALSLGEDVDSVLIYSNRALELSRRTGWKDGIGKSHYYIGHAYLRNKDQKDYVLDNFQKAVENLEDRNILVKTYGALTALYTNEREYDKALIYANLALESAGADPYLKIYGAICIADVYRSMKDYKTAMKHYRDVISILDVSDVENEAYLHISTLWLMSRCGDSTCVSIQESYDYAVQAKHLYNISGLKENSMYSGILASLGARSAEMVIFNCVQAEAARKKLLKDAETYTLEALNIDLLMGDGVTVIDHYDALYHIEKAKGDYKKALMYLEEYTKNYNSFYSQENKNKIAALEQEYQAKEYKLQLATKDKQFKYIVLLSLLLFIIAALLLIFYNLRKRKNKMLENLNYQLEERNIELARANNLKAKLFGIINHDLRKPVSYLISYLELKKNIPDTIDKEQEKAIEERGLELSENLLHNMEDLLAWSKSQMDNFKPIINKVKISSLFSEIHTFFNKTDLIQLSLEKDIIIDTDENYMKTIMRNLTFNAIQAAKAKNKIPNIRWTAQEDDSNIVFAINDNGGGMSSDRIKILEEGADNLSISSGLGLHIIHDLSTSLFFEIRVASSDSDGTIVTLLLQKDKAI